MKIKRILFFLLIVLVGIQFIPTKRNESVTVLETDFTKTFIVPSNIQNLLKKSCYDCHSNNTNYPWYNKIQPISWLLENHVTKGKKELNFNEFGTYSHRRQKSKLKSIISQIKDDEMPLFSYTLIHRDAKIAISDKELLLTFFLNMRDSIN